MTHKISLLCFFSCLSMMLGAQTPQPIKQFLDKPYLRGSSFSLIVKDIHSGKTTFAYDTTRQMTPASVMKTVTTATALEILGEDFRFATTVEYDGLVKEGVLDGNIFIKGSGDPTLGSKHFAPHEKEFINEWISALKQAGIKKINGAVIADESVFDTEGLSMKCVHEDMGTDYGAGCYGLSIFDNKFKLALQTGNPGTRPHIKATEPELTGIHFHNYLQTQAVSSDSTYIIGAPFAQERYLYGVLPANRKWIGLDGDIPDPALFIAQYMTKQLEHAGIMVKDAPTCYRILKENGKWKATKRTKIITTYSHTLKEIVSVTNHVSHNLYADALIKTIGLRYVPQKGEVISSFNRGIKVLRNYWEDKGFDLANVWMYDGSGLAVTSKLSTSFMANLLIYMRNHASHRVAFYESLPQPGIDGSVINFLKGTHLQGKVRIKSGSMSRVKGYAGYVQHNNKEYAVALFINNYDCDGRPMNKAIEDLLLHLFEAKATITSAK